MINHDIMITIVSTIALGVLAQVLAEQSKIPSIIFLLGIGIVSGPDGFNIVRPTLLGENLYVFTTLSVVIILFEGGLTLDIRNVKSVSRSVMNLITVGALVTWVGAALLTWLILGVSWTIAILFGALVIVTGPTVIGPLLRTVKIEKRIRTILKWEGILIDPVGAIVAVLVLGFIVSEESTLLGTMTGLGSRIVIGGVTGIVGGYLMSAALRLQLTESVRTLVIFAVVFLIFGAAELMLKESGIMSVTTAGIAMGNLRGPNLQHIKGFKEKLTILLVSVLFILLAANLRIAELEHLGWRGVFLVLCLMLVVRPLNVWASVREKSISLREKLFLSWIAPRGIVAAGVASLFALTLERSGMPEASIISSLTFLTIGITVGVQGLTAYPVARLLGVLQTGSTGLIILGGNEIALGMARELHRKTIPVTVIDSNNTNCLSAERCGLLTYCGDVLSDETWDQIDLANMGYFLAATSNNELNSLACSRAVEFFGHDHVFQIRNVHQEQPHEFTLAMIRGNQQYDLPLDVAGISGEIALGRLRIETVSLGTAAPNIETMSVQLCGVKEGKILFTTNNNGLTPPDQIIRIVGT